MRVPLLITLFLVAKAARPGSILRASVDDPIRRGSAAHVLRPDDAQRGNGEAIQPNQRWALLVAGSSGWWNYRHQADVCHAYHLIKGGGVHTANIVTMMYGDIAYHTDNPFPGKIFNRPGGRDVFRGVAIDYMGEDVNVRTLLAVLEGNKEAVASLGTGKVIDSGPSDEVFVFYSDHGSPGVLGMPTGNLLYADQLLGAIRRKHAKGGYKEMSVYIEACESGSLFQGMLEDDLNLYVTTAANANESSWGTYCPGLHTEVPLEALHAGNGSKELDTCMGDLFSVAWMEDTEQEDPLQETLRVQFEHVSLRTSDNYTYRMGSHVQRFGRVKAMEAEHVSDFLGFPENYSRARRREEGGGAAAPGYSQGPLQQYSSVPQRDADLVPLRYRAAHARTTEDRLKAQAKLDAVVKQRASVDAEAEELVTALFAHPETSDILLQNHGWQPEVVYRGSGSPHSTPDASYLAQLMSGTPGHRASSAPLVDSWECLREMEAMWAQVYGPFDQYSMRHTRLLANLCNSGLNEEAILAASLKGRNPTA